mgnify:CR=1 FL=1
MLNIFKQKKYKIFYASTMELWRKIYEFIYMPLLLLPLPVHMCVKENIFLWNNFLEKNEKFSIAEQTPSEARSHT